VKKKEFFIESGKEKEIMRGLNGFRLKGRKWDLS
jgi:hypothetical protein